MSIEGHDDGLCRIAVLGDRLPNPRQFPFEGGDVMVSAIKGRKQEDCDVAKCSGGCGGIVESAPAAALNVCVQIIASVGYPGEERGTHDKQITAVHVVEEDEREEQQ